MKILQITTHLDYGGIPNYIVTLSRALTQKGHKVSVISGGGPMVKQLEDSGIRHLEFDLRTKSEISPKLLFFMPKLLSIIKKEKPDILHAHTRVTQVLSQIARKKTNVKYVSTCHGFFKPKGARVLFPCWGDRVIAISEAVRKHLLDDFGVDDNKVKLIYNGIDLSKFSDDSSAEEKAEFKTKIGLKDGKVVGIISRLSDVKGHEYLFEAIAMVAKKYPGIQLLVVGDGPLKEKFIKKVKALGISDKVFFRASTYNVAKYLSIIDIFAMPTLQEGLGLSIIEAMAMGKPVIASDVAGVRTLIKDGETGLLVLARDPNAIKNAIERLLHDKALADRLASAGEKLVLDKFTVESMVEKVENTYREVLNDGSNNKR